MTQTIIVFFIIILAAMAMCYRVFRLFLPVRSDTGCTPDKCASCSSNVNAHPCDQVMKQ